MWEKNSLYFRNSTRGSLRLHSSILPSVGKSALAQLGELWEIKPEEMATFGDGGNDFEMLQFVGQGFASDAIPSIKAIADHIIGSNEAESVLTQIKKILVAEK